MSGNSNKRDGEGCARSEPCGVSILQHSSLIGGFKRSGYCMKVGAITWPNPVCPCMKPPNWERI